MSGWTPHMRFLVVFAISAALCALVAYGMAAFIAADWNIRRWPDMLRVLVAFGWLITISVACLPAAFAAAEA